MFYGFMWVQLPGLIWCPFELRSHKIVNEDETEQKYSWERGSTKKT